MARYRTIGPLLLVASIASAVSAQNNGARGGNGNANLIQPLAELQGQLKGKLERITIHAKALEGNLEGDSADREVFVYLPPSYERESARRYPVVYTLHGFGLHAQQWVGFANVAGLERGLAAGTTKEMILVSPDAFSLHNDHNGQVPMNFEKKVLPFFSKHLAFQ